MPAEVRVPVLGECIVDATVGAWLKREGEPVEAGEALVQLETEKVNVDVAADQDGVLGRIAHKEGDTVHPGDVLATITEATRAARAKASADGDAPTKSSADGEAPTKASADGDAPATGAAD